MKISVTIAALAILLAGCDPAKPSADQVQRQQQEMLSQEGNAQVGMPGIRNFAEKRFMKMVLELRDDPKLATITYITDLNGILHKRCDSIGYGLPYATQFTNPQRQLGSNSAQYPLATIPQADPNGLFSPASADGTWVLCLDPASKKILPVYIEDRVTVSPFPLQ